MGDLRMEELSMEDIKKMVMDKINQDLTVRVSVVLETDDGEEWRVIEQKEAGQIHSDFPNEPLDFPELNMHDVIFLMEKMCYE